MLTVTFETPTTLLVGEHRVYLGSPYTLEQVDAERTTEVARAALENLLNRGRARCRT